MNNSIEDSRNHESLGSWQGKKVVVMGLGLHGGGAGAAEFFAQQGARVVVTDLRSSEQLQSSLKKLEGLPISYVLGEHREEDFLDADLILKNPAVPNDSPLLRAAREQGVPIDTDIGIFFEQCPGFLIGVTGTKGKSTTASLVAHILDHAGIPTILAGNIRTSVLSVLSEVTQKTAVVLELSSFQLESLVPHEKSPKVAVLTNIFPDHLNRYLNMEEYVAAKYLAFRFQALDDLAILPVGKRWIEDFSQKVFSRKFFFCSSPQKSCSAKVHNEEISVQTSRVHFEVPLNTLSLPGIHNRLNALAALLAVAALPEHPLWKHGVVAEKDMKEALATFRGLEGRFQEIAREGGIQFINDTTATIPHATEEALRIFPKDKVILIAGGMDKGLSYTSLAKAIRERVKALVLLSGDASEELLKTLGEEKPPMFSGIDSMQEAVRTAFQQAKKGDTVLLSPAAASFNLFAHEFDRGEQFVRAVHALKISKS